MGTTHRLREPRDPPNDARSSGTLRAAPAKREGMSEPKASLSLGPQTPGRGAWYRFRLEVLGPRVVMGPPSPPGDSAGGGVDFR